LWDLAEDPISISVIEQAIQWAMPAWIKHCIIISYRNFAKFMRLCQCLHCSWYYTFIDSGAEVTLASPQGGQPPLDPKSNLADAQTEIEIGSSAKSHNGPCPPG
jgi:hypothetical protein